MLYILAENIGLPAM